MVKVILVELIVGAAILLKATILVPKSLFADMSVVAVIEGAEKFDVVTIDGAVNVVVAVILGAVILLKATILDPKSLFADMSVVAVIEGAEMFDVATIDDALSSFDTTFP